MRCTLEHGQADTRRVGRPMRLYKRSTGYEFACLQPRTILFPSSCTMSSSEAFSVPTYTRDLSFQVRGKDGQTYQADILIGPEGHARLFGTRDKPNKISYYLYAKVSVLIFQPSCGRTMSTCSPTPSLAKVSTDSSYVYKISLL